MCEICFERVNPRDLADHVRVFHPEDFKALMVESRPERHETILAA